MLEVLDTKSVSLLCSGVEHPAQTVNQVVDIIVIVVVADVVSFCCSDFVVVRGASRK